MDERNLYTYKQMQESLPDYVFERLNPEDKEKFEAALPQYPDIADEIRQVRSVFAKVEKMDIDAEISSKTRNMSVKVVNRMKNAPTSSNRYTFTMKYLIPTVGMIVIGFFFFNNGLPGIFTKNVVNSNFSAAAAPAKNDSCAKLMSKTDLALLFDNTLDDSELVSFSDEMAHSLTVSDLTDDDIADYISSETVDDFSENEFKIDPETINIQKTGNFYEFMDNLDQLDEEEFQKILKDLENADIFS